MAHPLIARLTTDFAFPNLDRPEALDTYLDTPGTHCLFVPGNPERNLESADVAVILPELVQAFQGLFDVAVVDDAIEESVRERAGVWKTPSLIFWRAGQQIGAIPKVRDWDDYLARIQLILASSVETAAE